MASSISHLAFRRGPTHFFAHAWYMRSSRLEVIGTERVIQLSFSSHT